MARNLLEDAFYEGTAFHCQQASEKVLKALATRLRIREATHACIDISENLQEAGVEVPQEVMGAAKRLDPHYSNARYLNAVGGAPQKFYDKDLAEECIAWMERILQFVKSKLN